MRTVPWADGLRRIFAVAPRKDLARWQFFDPSDRIDRRLAREIETIVGARDDAQKHGVQETSDAQTASSAAAHATITTTAEP